MKRSFVIAIIITIFTGCIRNGNQPVSKAPGRFCIPDSLMKQIKTDTISFRPVMEELKLIGKVAFDQDKMVKLYPLVSGNVLEVNVTLVDYVEKGQILAIVNSAEIAGAENDIVAARANVAVAEKNQLATEGLYKSGIASEKEHQAALRESEKARSELNKATTLLSIYGGSQSHYIIKSPISGYIVEKFINPGMQIRPDNSTNLFTISDLKKVWILANVYESDIAGIAEGEKVTVRTISYPDKVFTGAIDKIYNVLDPDNKTMKVRVQLENIGNMLKPEMFANVIVEQVRDTSMLAVPAKSVVFDRNKHWVLIYINPCNIQPRQIDIVKSTSLFSYVRSGVTAGEKVITNRQLLIYNAITQ